MSEPPELPELPTWQKVQLVVLDANGQELKYELWTGPRVPPVRSFTWEFELPSVPEK